MSDSNAAGKCGCGTSTQQSTSTKKNDQCSESSRDQSPFANQAKCPKPKKTTKDGKCHSSHEQFHKKDKDESQSKFLEECDSKREKESCGDKRQNSCDKTESSENQICKDKYQEFTNRKVEEKYPQSNELKEKDPCQSLPKNISKDEEACRSESKKITEGSVYSKFCNNCVNLAKQFVALKPKSKCNSTNETLQKDICKKTLGLTASKPPCQPTSEKGAEMRNQAKCMSKVTCPQADKQNISDFFPLDARNKQLNECIEKYMKIDSSLVISKCSQFANMTTDMSEKCVESMKRSQERCLQTVKTSAIVKRSSPLLAPRLRQLAGRWAPSAALYLTTSALVTVYVTEWKTVLKHVPFYSHLEEEDNAPS